MESNIRLGEGRLLWVRKDPGLVAPTRKQSPSGPGCVEPVLARAPCAAQQDRLRGPKDGLIGKAERAFPLGSQGTLL